MSEDAYRIASSAIDRANSDDPRTQEADGRTWPQEVLYSSRMVEWVRRLSPGASEELLLAARAQHVRRWTVPRAKYPEGRFGYLQWREALKRFHADLLGTYMKQAGYGEAPIQKARTLLLRKNLATDVEGQTLEDAACLVFLQYEFGEFAAKTEPDKMVDILRKSWAKMSPPAREQALKLDYGATGLALVQKALESPAAPR